MATCVCQHSDHGPSPCGVRFEPPPSEHRALVCGSCRSSHPISAFASATLTASCVDCGRPVPYGPGGRCFGCYMKAQQSLVPHGVSVEPPTESCADCDHDIPTIMARAHGMGQANVQPQLDEAMALIRRAVDEGDMYNLSKAEEFVARVDASVLCACGHPRSEHVNGFGRAADCGHELADDFCPCAQFGKPGTAPTCRRCSECADQEHHWLDYCDERMGAASPTHECKHCEALGDECETCGGDGEYSRPDGEPVMDALCRDCRGFGVVERKAATPETP